jgi:hypothetical protein
VTDYYHDEEHNTIYTVEEPTVFAVSKPKSYRNPHPPINYYSLSRKIVVTSADEPADHNEFIDEEYPGRDYTRRQALDAFEQSFQPPGSKIEHEQYLQLKELFQK